MLRRWVLFLGFGSLLLSQGLALSPSQQVSLAAKFTHAGNKYGDKVGATFLDLKTGWQISINGSQEFPAASIAKVPVMMTAYHLADLGLLNLNQKVPFRESDKLGGSGILQWLRGGKTYTLRNLIRMMIVLSDNTATRLVVRTIGTAEINSYLLACGAARTVIRDPTMLIEPPSRRNNLTTPNNMAQLVSKLYHSEGFTALGQKEMLSYMRNQRYRWGLWRGVPSGTVIANKTGNLTGILNDVGIVYTKKGNYVLSIFTNGFAKKRDGRTIINQLSRAAYEIYTGEKVPEPKKTVRKKPLKKKKKVRHRHRY